MDLQTQLYKLIERGEAVNDTPLPRVAPSPQWTTDDWSPSAWHRPGLKPRDVTRLIHRVAALLRDAA
jgi:hypothetical protein